MNNKSNLIIKPLGGVGQIGSNMTLIQSRSKRVVIDCGILFPYEDFFDINYLIPNLSQEKTFDAIVFTHGHEDHIGAIYHFILHSPDAEIYASDFTAALIRKKLNEFNLNKRINIFTASSVINFEEFDLSPIHVNHSIPETFGLLLRDPDRQFCFFYASDFKVDFKTKYEKPFDLDRLVSLSSNIPVRIFLSDSTNILSSNLETPSEFDLISHFEEVFKNLENRLFITLFSSNIHRLKTIIDLCEKYEFKFVPHGRSLLSYLNIAKEAGMIPNYDQVVRTVDQIDKNQKNLCIGLTGCQGDFLGTLRRVAFSEDSTFKLNSNDTVIFSSKPIPGNEKKISLISNKITSTGAKLITDPKKLFHVSGHPGKLDLLKIYQNFKPTTIIPIHGETLFLKEHQQYILHSYPQAEVIIVDNFDEIHLDDFGKIIKQKCDQLEPVLIHGKNLPIEKDKISERRKIACNGAIFLSLKRNIKNSYITEYEITFSGLPDYFLLNRSHFDIFFENYLSKNKINDIDKFKEETRISIRRYFDNTLGYKPMTYIHMVSL